ncbi:hypothetical protein [Clostridium sp. AM58-1XD]|uniref:hypothetical protein n=1 Tax=Clostridium sp. AM58-1XD TaxID=2292307 RepID=UPI002680527D
MKNLELFGIPNICVTSEAPKKLAALLPEFFDAILIDAPCSGEGMFRKDDGMVKDWMEKGPSYYAPIQAEIAEEAVSMLRPGGHMLYSTCTFSVAEDEAVINGLLARHPELELIRLPRWEGAENGIGLDGCIRLFPHKIRGEGHFIALLRKRGGDGKEAPKNGKHINDKNDRLPEEAADFLSGIKASFMENGHIRVINDSVYLLPSEFPDYINCVF